MIAIIIHADPGLFAQRNWKNGVGDDDYDCS